MGSGAVIYVPSFIKIGSGVQKLIGGIHRRARTHTHTRTETWSPKPTLFFQNKESRLIIRQWYWVRLCVRTRRLQMLRILPLGGSANSGLTIISCRRFHGMCLFSRDSWHLYSVFLCVVYTAKHSLYCLLIRKLPSVANLCDRVIMWFGGSLDSADPSLQHKILSLTLNQSLCISDA
jgi:hypothetical protein